METRQGRKKVIYVESETPKSQKWRTAVKIAKLKRYQVQTVEEIIRCYINNAQAQNGKNEKRPKPVCYEMNNISNECTIEVKNIFSLFLQNISEKVPEEIGEFAKTILIEAAKIESYEMNNISNVFTIEVKNIFSLSLQDI